MPRRLTMTGSFIAGTSLLLAVLTGCSDDSGDDKDEAAPDKPAADRSQSPKVDFGDPQSVAEAWGRAIASGACTEVVKLSSGAYTIDCDDPESHNDWLEIRGLGAKFKSAEPDTDSVDEDGNETSGPKNRPTFNLTFTLPDGQLAEEEVILEQKGGKWKSRSSRPRPADFDPE